MMTSKQVVYAFCVAAATLCLAGCAGRKPAPKNYVFFPLPPDEPRIQHLMSFGAESDLGEQSGWTRFIVGAERVHRPITKPYGVAIRNGNIYVCDTQAGNISIANMTTRRMRYIRPVGQAAIKVPIGVAADADGTIYVTDRGRNQVLIFNDKGDLLDTLGRKGEMEPSGIALAGDRLYVTDMTNNCVRVYNKANRQQVLTVPCDPADQKARLLGPTNVAVDQQGRIYVSDSRDFSVKIYDAEGKHLRTIGELGVTPGQFALPKGIGADHEGRVYVVDAAAPVVQLFDAEGRLLMFFGEPHNSGPAGLYLPAGLAVDYDNVALFKKDVAPGYQLEYLILVVNQVGPNKISVFGFIKKA